MSLDAQETGKAFGATGAKPGDVLLCPVFSIANRPKPITGDPLLFELVNIQGQGFLRHRVREEKEERYLQYDWIYLKLHFFCMGLSVATFGHFWVEGVLLDDNLNEVWRQPKAVRLVVDKEIDPEGPNPLTFQEFAVAEDV